MVHNRSSERGQALVLLVLAIVGVIGFSALAIDGGMLYAERRRAQNAADTSVFAAAMAGLQSGDWNGAGVTQAAMNGFSTDALNTVTVYHPPVAPWSPAQYLNNPEYYMVVITTQFEPFFAQFVYSGTLENTVWAIAKAKPSQSISPGNAIHATSSADCNAVWFQGAAGAILYDAGIYSNSTANSTNSSCTSILKKEGDLTIQNGSLTAVGSIYGSSEIVLKDENGNIIPSEDRSDYIQAGSDPQDISAIAPPVCNGVARDKDDSGNKVDGIYYLQPGEYADGIDVSKDEVHLAPGIYCLDDDLKMTSSGGVLIGEGVLIYLRGKDASLNQTGGTLVLKSATGAPLYDNGSPAKDWSGMVIYSGLSNEGMINISGGSGAALWGTIYAPGHSKNASAYKCDITGNAESFNYRAQLVCYTARVTGNTLMEIHYEETEQYHEPPMVELAQ